MKLIKFLIVLFICNSTLAQRNAKIEKGFFNLKEIKVAVSLGADISLAGDNGRTGMVKSLGNISEENIFFGQSVNYSIGLDFYSAKSKLGFLLDPTLSNQNNVYRVDNAVFNDSISTSHLEIPFYLKLRLGSITSNSSFWITAGTGYSIPLKVKQNFLNKNSDLIEVTLEDKDMFKPIPFLSSIIGYELILASGEKDGKEIYDRDDARLLLFLKVNYDLDNRLNASYNFGSNTSLGNISSPDLQFLRVSFGAKLLLRFSKAGYALGEAYKTLK